MKRFRKDMMWRPPTAADSAASADALEGFRRRPSVSQDLAPVGQTIIVKTPPGGIDARDGTTISSAVCTRLIEIDAASSTKTLVETDEELRVYNLEPAAVAGDTYVTTGITLHGTRYVGLPSASHWAKLDADLLFNDTVGVTVSIWAGNPLTDTLKNIDNVLPPPLMAGGQFNLGDFVEVGFRDSLPYVTGAPCNG